MTGSIVPVGVRAIRAGVAVALFVAVLGGGACHSGVALSVDLRTDYVPGREFASILTDVTTGGASREARASVAIGQGGFVDGTRVADFSDLQEGVLDVRVRVLAPSGAVLVERLARVSAHGDYALTVVATRSCAGVTCPEPAGDPTLTTCDRGACVSPECTPETPERCGAVQCGADAGCRGKVSCVSGRCVMGTCLFVPDDSQCNGSICDANVGCAPPLFGTCSPTGPTETNCKDGIDDDCDGLVDCVDPDCNGAGCDDGNACTTGETCSGNACTHGTPVSCDDGNACTDDACDATSGCQHTNNTSPCDDGVFCNGADTCSGGACTVHAGDPCSKGCDESAKKCLACAVDADCGPVTTGAWGACGGFASTCATSGSQSRTVTTPKCVSGACTTTSATQSQGCTRSVANGTTCGTDRYCCSGSCVAKNDPNHCSSCGARCASGNCASIGGGQYACTCTSNAECVNDGFGSGATCWSPSGTMFCNCQCTTAGCCSGGANCYRPSGLNYCSY